MDAEFHKVIPAGRMLYFSTGTHSGSDYRIVGFGKTMRPLTEVVWNEMSRACIVLGLEGRKYVTQTNAVPWLVANGYIRPLEFYELHLGTERCEIPEWDKA